MRMHVGLDDVTAEEFWALRILKHERDEKQREDQEAEQRKAQMRQKRMFQANATPVRDSG
jgi:hypothetical protein